MAARNGKSKQKRTPPGQAKKGGDAGAGVTLTREERRLTEAQRALLEDVNTAGESLIEGLPSVTVRSLIRRELLTARGKYVKLSKRGAAALAY